jgi:Zn-dependent protease
MTQAFRFSSVTEIMRINRVPVYAHWSLVLVWAVILLAAFVKPGEALTAWTAYSLLILLHECGHMLVAQSRGCRVTAIDLYPIHGITHFELPWSRYDHALIAWGGVAAQVVVAVPLIAGVEAFGYTPWKTANLAINILGYYSVLLAVFNLLPMRPLDGATAWHLFPELVKRVRKPTVKRKVGWRGW